MSKTQTSITSVSKSAVEINGIRIINAYFNNPTDENLSHLEKLMYNTLNDSTFRKLALQLMTRIRNLTTKNVKTLAINKTLVKHSSEEQITTWILSFLQTNKGNTKVELILHPDENNRQRQIIYEGIAQITKNLEQANGKRIYPAVVTPPHTWFTKNDCDVTKNLITDVINANHGLVEKNSNLEKFLEQDSAKWKKEETEYKTEIDKCKILLQEQQRYIEMLKNEASEREVKFTQLTKLLNDNEQCIIDLTNQNSFTATTWETEKNTLQTTQTKLVEKIQSMEKQKEFATENTHHLLRENDKLQQQLKQEEIARVQQTQRLQDSLTNKAEQLAKKENEIIEARETIKNVLELLNEANLKHICGLDNFNNVIASNTQTMSIEQISEQSTSYYRNTRLDVISTIKHNIQTYQNDIPNCRTKGDDRQFLHLQEILIRALEGLDNVPSRGDEIVQNELQSASAYVKGLYNILMSQTKP